MEYLLHLLILVGIYVMLSQSLNLSAGFGGMISLAHAGFYGVGAYTAALFAVNFQLPFLLVLPVAMLLSGLLALIVSAIALRTIDDYFIICTLGIQVIVFSLMNNWMSLTRGPLGIPGIPGIQLFGFGIENKWAFLLMTLCFVALIFFFLKKLTGSSFGRTLRALSEDEIFTQSLGKNVYLTKVIAFTTGAMLAAIPGVLYAHYISYIDPTSFTVDESIFILSIVIIGGMRNLWGSVIAAAFLVLLPEALRFVGMPNAIAANMRQIIYGGILIFMMFRYSRGFVSEKTSKNQ
jgi:branched-chain amino acid transport system permease protein